MPVVRGERIGESERLNLRSPEAQDFYAHFVAVIPDDFRRFRLAPSQIAGVLYPRRVITSALRKRVERLLLELGTGERPLWKTWVVDGVTFAELATGKDRGNRYHRTPEPPWSIHHHQGACLATAIARVRDWGHPEELERLSLLMRQIRDRKRTGSGARSLPGGPSPSPPSPPSPRINGSPPAPQTGGADLDQADDFTPEETDNGHRPQADVVEAARLYAIQAGFHPSRQERRQMREAVLAGHTLEDLKTSIDEARARGQPTLTRRL